MAITFWRNSMLTSRVLPGAESYLCTIRVAAVPAAGLPHGQPDAA
jgi:hypothetical protein